MDKMTRLFLLLFFFFLFFRLYIHSFFFLFSFSLSLFPTISWSTRCLHNTYTAHRHAHARHIRTSTRLENARYAEYALGLYVNVRVRNTAYGRNRIINAEWRYKNAIWLARGTIRNREYGRRWFVMNSIGGSGVVNDEVRVSWEPALHE